MTAITEAELTVEQWCGMLGVDLEWYRRHVDTDALLHALDTLARELWVSRQRVLDKAREFMADEDGVAVWAAASELYQLAGGDALDPGQLRQLHEQLFRPGAPPPRIAR